MGPVFVLVRAAFTRRRAMSLALLGVVVALASAALTSAIAIRADAADRVDEASTAAAGPDLVVWVDRAVAADVEATMNADDRVAAVAAPVDVTDGEVVVGGGRVESELRSMSGSALNRPVIVDGRLPGTDGELVLDAGYAIDAGVAVGDQVDLVAGGRENVRTVVGLAYDFTDCFYPTCDPIHIWVPAEESLDGATALVAVDLHVSGDAGAVEETIRAEFGDGLRGANDWSDTRSDLLVETEFFGAFLAAFAVFVLVCCGIVIIGAMTARTAARRRATGICKSTGCSTTQVAGSLVIEHLVVGVLASSAGIVAASAVVPRFRLGSMRVLDASASAVSFPTALSVIVAVSLLIVLATVVPAVRAARTSVVDAVSCRSGARPWRPTTVLSRLPIPVALGAGGVMARPLRTVLSIAAVVIAIVTAVVSMSITRSVDHMLEHPELGGDPHGALVVPPDDMTRHEVERRLSGVRGADGWYTVRDERMDVDGAPVHVRVIGDPAASGYVIGGGSSITDAGDAIAGYGLLQERGWSIGDDVTVTAGSEVVGVTLVGWYRETEDSGQILQVSEDAFPGSDDRPEAYAVNSAADADPTQLGVSLRAAFGDGARVVVTETDTDQVAPFRIALATMTAMIAAVVVAHLVATSLTAMRERSSRTGILRTLGMDTRAIALEAGSHACAVAIVAVAAGLPLGWFVQAAIGDLLTGALGAGPGLTLGPDVMQLAAVAVAAVLVTTAIAIAVTLPSLRRPAAAQLGRSE